jgi:hypothetical protein
MEKRLRACGRLRKGVPAAHQEAAMRIGRQRGSETAPCRRRLLALAAAPLLAAGRSVAADARLVMLERHDCPWCRRWLREVGEASWNGSDLGRRAPLRRVDVAAGLPGDLAFLRNWRFTPTFVLVAGGRELGRITGYQSDWFFWQQAEALFAALPRQGEEERP